MKSKFFLFLILTLQTGVSFSKVKKTNKPKLIIGLVVDQMRADFLTRFAYQYGADGFLKLMQQGHVCSHAMINYLPSYTAPGHTCIYTGTVPAIHGIASNDWFQKETLKPMYCTYDPSVHNIGGTRRAGTMSPRNLWTTTITDELRLASNFKSKVIAISVKDRASILPGGHTANAAYWMDDSMGVFMSSNFYAQQLPAWVDSFNRQDYAGAYMAKNWDLVYPKEKYLQSTADNNTYEGKFPNEVGTAFPHQLATLRRADIKKTPYGNDMVFDFAKATIENEHLGQDSETDFLALSFSSTDYVGHMYGPNSLEIEDTYVRFDKRLASFMQYLDETIGPDEYTLFLTADHGVAHNPSFLQDQKIPAGFFVDSVYKKKLNEQLKKQFNIQDAIFSISENYIWLHDSLIKNKQLNRQEIINEIIQECSSWPEVHFALDMKNIQAAVLPSQIKEMAIHGFVQNRSGDILLLLKPGWIDAYALTGTTHGTWNPYDTHIPLIWYGKGIQTGETIRQVHMTDIAATIASLLQIQMPNGCIGVPIPEVISR
ncbi:MAG: alkaline phosphatase PafA [Chitinophagaceae bacterium]